MLAIARLTAAPPRRPLGVAIALVCLTRAAASLANDATFGGAGADLVPLSQQAVAMRSEDITLTANDLTWDVRARYVFFNEAATPVTVQVGFPEYHCERESEGDCANVAFRNLLTRVDGKAVAHRSGQLDKRHAWASYLGKIWLFDVTFPPQRELVIEHEYSLASGTNVMSDRFTTYVTRTGTGWKGSIGSARFLVVLPPYAHTVAKPQIPGATVHAPRLLLDGKPRVELLIEAHDWKPQGEVSVSFNASAALAEARLPGAAEAWGKPGPLPYDTLFHGTDCLFQSEPAAATARDCKNLIYASKGYAFQNRELAQRYYGSPPAFQLVKTDLQEAEFWVRRLSALPSFDVASFDASERSWLARLEVAGKLPPAPSAAAAASASAAPAARPPLTSASAVPATSTTPAAARKSCACRAVGLPTNSGALLVLAALAGTLRRRRRGV